MMHKLNPSLSTAVCSLAINLFHAEAIVAQLMVEGFSIRAVSLLLVHKDGRKDFVNQLNDASPNGANRGGLGCILDGALAGLGEVCALEIPGNGTYMGVGPTIAALSATVFGTRGSSLCHALASSLALPQFEAECYAEKIRAGSVLICIQTENEGETYRAAQIVERYEAEYIATSRLVSRH
jgi:hypothetical protein